MSMGAIAVIGSLAFIGWVFLGWGKRKRIKDTLMRYIHACIAGVFIFTFFLTMDIPEVVKILASIILGGALIFIAAWFQRRIKPEES